MCCKTKSHISLWLICLAGKIFFQKYAYTKFLYQMLNKIIKFISTPETSCNIFYGKGVPWSALCTLVFAKIFLQLFTTQNVLFHHSWATYFIYIYLYIIHRSSSEIIVRNLVKCASMFLERMLVQRMDMLGKEW